MNWFAELGYLGLFLGCAMAGTVLPLSSDLVLLGVLLAGCDPWLCLFIAACGNWLGSMTSYGMGWAGKWEWLAKFDIRKEKLEKQRAFIDKYGIWAALVSWFPLVGTLSVIALGFYRVKPKTTALLLFIGHLVRYTAWILLYVYLGTRFIEWVTK